MGTEIDKITATASAAGSNPPLLVIEMVGFSTETMPDQDCGGNVVVTFRTYVSADWGYSS